MFGYVKPYVPELKVSEYEKYRAAYCGLCRSIGQVTGQLSRLTLSYDLVFLVAVRMVLEGINPEFKPMYCLVHPMKKRLVMTENSALTYAVQISAVLADEKNRDDLNDEHGIDKIKSSAVYPMLSAFAKTAEKDLPADCRQTVREKLEKLNELEKQGSTSLNDTADAFGEVLRYVFSLGLTGEKAEIAGIIGYNTGRFAYICDAADDMTDDIKKHRYNPIAEGWGELALTDGKMSPMVKEAIMISTPIELEKLGDETDKLDNNNIMTPIIKNTVYLGMLKSLEHAVEDKKKNTEKQMENDY